MSLDLPQLLPQVEKMGDIAVQRAAERRAQLPALLRALDATSSILSEEVMERIGRAGSRWPGAIPTVEPANAAIACPPHPPRLTVLGADGSQVYPDRHASALFYLINIGSQVIVHGSGQVPETESSPRLFYEEADLYGEHDGLIPLAIVDGQRDTAEMAELARLAEKREPPCLALLDNGLLLWLALQAAEQNRPQVDRLLDEYLHSLTALRRTGAAVAGFVDRPRAANVLALLHLVTLPLDQIREETVRTSPFRGLSDRSVFAARLRPGDRSARFTNASPVNRRFEEAGHAIQFFYVHCGPTDQIARVEIPAWVGDDPQMLDVVHAGVVEQCRTTQGFPYVLARAHELAVVAQTDRQALEQMLSNALLRRGLTPSPSQKALTKQWLGGKRRHRL